ncbi:unnamed protein product [Clavelina lepadiformis]|uniref:Uncharacterized protein n=1 Tax=Clavelina lepadiformis TaxID=159417 RepID=A0ABP0G4U4_CLALP
MKKKFYSTYVLQLKIFVKKNQPCMRSIERRTLTFLNNAKSWVMFGMNLSFYELAEAGWCYTGNKDRVKCWYCSGILQQWHAKWLLLFEYILQRKRGDYVFGVVSRFPNLRRPNISYPANAEEIERIRRMLPRSTPAGEILMRSLREDDELQIVRPETIRDRTEFDQFLVDIQRKNIRQWSDRLKSESAWVVESVCNVEFYINPFRYVPIGTPEALPEFIISSKGLCSLNLGRHGPFRDNLYFLRCVALQRQKLRGITKKRIDVNPSKVK